MKKRLGSTLLAALLFQGCAGVHANDIPGAYRADYPLAEEELTLHPDGRLVQRVTLKRTHEQLTSSSTWRYRQSEGYVAIDGPFLLVQDSAGALRNDYHIPSTGIVVLPVEHGLMGLQIGTSEGTLYRKR